MVLVLASASPRRLELLKQIDIEPDVVAPTEIDETPLPRELPRTYAARMAERKSAWALMEHQGSWVIAADTVVALGRRILGKASNIDEARQYLMLLSGRRHRVFGAITVVAEDGRAAHRVVETVVTFKRLHSLDVDRYLDSREWRDKAGAYAIQGAAGAFVRQISGSYSNVVGLSLYDLWSMLEGLGWQPVAAR